MLLSVYMELISASNLPSLPSYLTVVEVLSWFKRLFKNVYNCIYYAQKLIHLPTYNSKLNGKHFYVGNVSCNLAHIWFGVFGEACLPTCTCLFLISLPYEEIYSLVLEVNIGHIIDLNICSILNFVQFMIANAKHAG